MGRAFSEIKRQQLKKKIDDVARQLFREYGWSGVSVSQITRAVGIAKGSFYNFYETKESLYMTFVAEVEAEIQQHIKQEMLGASDKKLTLERLVLEIIVEIEENKLMLDLFDPQLFVKISNQMPDAQVEDFMRVDYELLKGLVAMGMILRVEQELAVDLLRSLFFMGQQSFGSTNTKLVRKHLVKAVINEVFE